MIAKERERKKEYSNGSCIRCQQSENWRFKRKQRRNPGAEWWTHRRCCFPSTDSVLNGFGAWRQGGVMKEEIREVGIVRKYDGLKKEVEIENG